MQTTLLGLAIAFIIALIAALVGPYFVDWNQFRPQFEAEASRVTGVKVRVEGALDARLLPAPSLRLRSVVVGGAGDVAKVRADKLDVEFSLGSLMRGEWRASELTINGMALDLGLDAQGRLDWPASAGSFNLGSLAIDRLNLTGRIALHDATGNRLDLNDIAFAGDVRALAGSIRGDGNFMLAEARYPFRVSSAQIPDGSGTRVHLTVDPGARGRFLDLDGVLSFAARTPRFDGAVSLSGPAAGARDDARWRVAARLKADPATARLEQLEASYGDETGLKFTGLADLRFGSSPLLHAVLAARQLDADRLLAGDSSAAPTRLLPGLRSLVAAIPPPPLSMQIELTAEQIMLGGRPVQNLAAELRGDSASWTVDRLEFRAPGATRVELGGELARPGPSGRFKGKLTVNSPDPNAFAGWLQGRGELVPGNQKPLRLSGNVDLAATRVAIDGMTAEIDGGTLEGAVGISVSPAGGSLLEAALKADRLDLDAATALVRSLSGPQIEWPDEAQLSLDIGRAVAAGQELRPFVARLGYGPKLLSLDQLRIGQASGVMMEGAGSFDRVNATGKLTLNASTPSVAQLTTLMAPVAPAAVIARLDAMAVRPGPARLKLSVDLDRNSDRADRATARAALEIEAPQVKGVATLTALPAVAAMRAIDLDALTRSEIGIEASVSSEQGRSLLALFGLGGVIAAGEGPARFEGSAAGTWRAPLRLKARLSGTELDAEAQGTAEPWGAEPKAAVNLSLRRANLAPLLDRNPADALAYNISLSSRVMLAGSKLTFDDADGNVRGSRLRGRVVLDLGDKKSVEGEVGMDTL
ncbi:MAG TPA: AsmA family protein, partial [Bradyrhizobium sp.]|nr:AsmA family protein [Bradyrhizobium sp.]